MHRHFIACRLQSAMLLVLGLAWLLVLPSTLAAASGSNRLQKLQKLTASAPDKVIRFNTALYEEFTTAPAGERDYALSVVLTALKPEFNCAQCRCVELSLSGVSLGLPCLGNSMVNTQK